MTSELEPPTQIVDLKNGWRDKTSLPNGFTPGEFENGPNSPKAGVYNEAFQMNQNGGNVYHMGGVGDSGDKEYGCVEA